MGTEDKRLLPPRVLPASITGGLPDVGPKFDQPKKDPTEILPPHVKPLDFAESIIRNFEPKPPDFFWRQAQQAVRFVLELDKGGGLEDLMVKRFLAQVGQMDYIAQAQHAVVRNVIPQAILPFWLRLDFLREQDLVRPQAENLDAEGRKLASNLYDQWIEDRKTRSSHTLAGRYDRLPYTKSDTPSPRQFKIYVEQVDIINATQNGSLTQALDQLRIKRLAPNSMKLHDGDRLVIYFDLDIDVSENVEEILHSAGVNYRGPGQDVDEVLIDDKSGLVIRTKESNDNALKEYSFRRHGVSEYTPRDFLQKYLSLCFKVGKNPARPYLTSFVYLRDKGGKFRSQQDEVLKKAAEMSGYSVVYTAS